ncbi:unnamed protein product, partial [Cyprideis torosa]
RIHAQAKLVRVIEGEVLDVAVDLRNNRANGQLAYHFRQLSEYIDAIDFVFLTSKELDITDFGMFENLVSIEQPNYLINCAAYTKVDKAEQEEELSVRVNTLAVENMAKLSKKYGFHLVHFSTDFVFGDDNIHFLKEDDETSPLSVYGNTKLKGEEAIAMYSNSYTIIRTSWVYSYFGANFYNTMIRISKNKTIKVVSDQIGTPTYAGDLASFVLDNLDKLISNKNQIYHYSNEGVASWYDFAVMIMNVNDIDCEVVPITTAEYPTLAVRPKFSVMDKSKIKKDFNISINHWTKSL